MDPVPTTNSESTAATELAASVQVLTLPAGTYAFTVKEGGASATNAEGSLTLPALQVGLAPVRSPGTIEFLSGATTLDRWLTHSSDVIVAKISGGSVSLLLTSLRTPNSPVLAIDVRRVEAPVESVTPQTDYESSGALPMRVVAHIRNVGDIYFDDGWIGCLGDKLWIEAFAILSAGNLAPEAVEYCAVNTEGFQTPWLGGQELCGSRGMGLPMMGFAIRLKPEVADRYDCHYSGRFVSGNTVGPMKNGELCCSNVPGDPLWGIQLQIALRSEVTAEKTAEEIQDSTNLAQVG
jgi:hypothetical protein